MDVAQAIRTRRSIARLDGDVPRETIRQLVELGCWAPNHHLTEPWRFTVLRGDDRERLGRFWGAIAADAQGLAGDAREESIRRDVGKLLRAPVLIVVSTRTDPDPVVAEEDLAATAAAVQNMLLGASALGLGAAWRTGRMVHDAAVKSYLGLDPSDRIVAVVHLGQPAMDAPPGQARNVDAVLTFR
jgi:nitroreductase